LKASFWCKRGAREDYTLHVRLEAQVDEADEIKGPLFMRC